MSELMWIRSHVERLLQDEWNQCRVRPDGDGDFPFRRGTAAGWVTVIDADELPMVRVLAVAAVDIKPTAAVHRELNDIQQRCTSAAVLWADGRVYVSQTISPIGLTRPVLAQALNAVGEVADDIGLLLAGMFNGSTPYPADTTVPEDEDAA